jgi:hypothetical protein
MTVALNRNMTEADELGFLREQVKEAKERIDELRFRFIGPNPPAMQGSEWQVEVRHPRHRRLDQQALLEHFGAETLKPFYVQDDTPHVYTLKRKTEAA